MELIENRQFHLIQSRSFLSNDLVEDIQFFPAKFKDKNYNIFSEGQNPIYKSFLQNGNVFFPEGNWNHYISVSGGEDLKTIRENCHNKRITWVHSNSDICKIYNSIQENYDEFTKTYNKLISTIPNTNLNISKIKSYYSSLKENYIINEGCRNTIQNSAFLTYLLHLSEHKTHSQSKNFSYIKSPLFWKEKINTISEWNSGLKNINIVNRGIDNVSLLREKTFIYTDFDYVGKMSDDDFVTYYNLLNSENQYLAVSTDKKSLTEKFENRGWYVYPISNTKDFIANYRLSGLNTKTIKENNSYTHSYLNAYKQYCSNLI